MFPIRLPSEYQDHIHTKTLINESDCLGRITALIHDHNTRHLDIGLVFDRITYMVAGEHIERILRKENIPFTPILFEPTELSIISAAYDIAHDLARKLVSQNLFPIAIGSGTINDLVKCAADEAGTMYICIPTAPSMDGYCSSGAALIRNGIKVTVPCPPPVAVLADSEIIRTAPYPMTASGYGDLYSKRTAGMDWIIADRLGIEPIHTGAWNMVHTDLDAWLADPKRLQTGDRDAYDQLFSGLCLCGFAMQLYQDSRPASGAEHMISHIWEMEHLSIEGLPVSHGFKVGVGVVVTTTLMEKLFALEDFVDCEGFLRTVRERRETWTQREQSIDRYFTDPAINAKIKEICRSKWISNSELENRMRLLFGSLKELKHLFKIKLGSSQQVLADLREAKCPVGMGGLGVSRDNLFDTVMKAQMIRSRYTVLDVLYEAGLLQEFLNSAIADGKLN